MAFLNAANFVRLGAVLMILCAVLHMLAWSKTRAQFPAEAQGLAALLWFLLAVDWTVVGALWLLAAQSGPALRSFVMISAIVPVAVAIGLILTLGPAFFPVYLQLGAALLAIAGAFRLS